MQIQYVIIIISFVVPLFILSYKFGYFYWFPQVGYGAVISDIVNGIAPGGGITAMGHDFAILPSPEFAMPWDPATGQTAFQWLAICFLFHLHLLIIKEKL